MSIDKIFKIIFMFLFLGITVIGIFSIIYFYSMDKNITLWESFIFSCGKMINYTIGSFDKSDNYSVEIVSIIQSYIGKLIPISLTGYMFYLLLYFNRKNIIFSEFMIIRFRKSTNKEDDLSLSLVVINKNKQELYDAVCKLFVICDKKYSTNKKEIKLRTQAIQSTSATIENFYQFSFDINKIPGEIWSAFIDNTENNYHKAKIIIVFDCMVDTFGNRISKKHIYQIKDFVIASGYKHEDLLSGDTSTPNRYNAQMEINAKDLVRTYVDN